MKNMGSKIIAAVVVIIMIVPIIIDAVSNSVLTTIKYDKLSSTVSSTSNYDFALVYVASSEDKNIDKEKASVKDVVNKYKSVSTDKPLSAYYMDYDLLTASEKSNLFKEDSKDTEAYVFIVNGEIVKVVEGSLSDDKLTDLVEFYSTNAEEIAEDVINYNVPKDSKEFNKIAKNKEKVAMFVFGRETCFYCNQFKVVYNTVIEEYDLDNIYYIDSDSYDKDEYSKIMDSGLTIPAKCSSTGEEVVLQTGFGTPLTLFTKNGKVIDCINGYVNKSNLITQLETVGIIKSEK